MALSRNIIEKVRIANNFEYLGPLTRDELFFDRVKEMQDALVVCGQIVKGTTGGVLILGGRGSGKTSFLARALLYRLGTCFQKTAFGSSLLLLNRACAS